MAKTIIEANYNRHDYERDTFQDAIIYSVDFNVAGTPTKITNAGLTTFGVDAIATTTATQITFDTLKGNLPWSSYSKFLNVNPRTTSPSIPVGSMSKPGSISIYELGVGTEVMYYGSITWTSATAGTFNNVKRAGATGGTSYVFTTAATGTFVNVIPIREKMTIWNRTGGILYIGDSQAIATTPTNAIQLGQHEIYSVYLEPLQELWVLPAVAGTINIAEYR